MNEEEIRPKKIFDEYVQFGVLKNNIPFIFKTLLISFMKKIGLLICSITAKQIT